jgi:hypothetical protein
MANILTKLLGSIPDLINNFADILMMSPIQAVLLIMGGILVAVSVVIMGYLTLGALFRPLGNLGEPAKGRQNRQS